MAVLSRTDKSLRSDSCLCPCLNVCASAAYLCSRFSCEQRGYQLAAIDSVTDFLATRDAVRTLSARFGAWVGLRSRDDKGDSLGVTPRPHRDARGGAAVLVCRGMVQMSDCRYTGSNGESPVIVACRQTFAAKRFKCSKAAERVLQFGTQRRMFTSSFL